MPRIPFAEKRRGVFVSIPESLYINVKLLLLDPKSGRVAYGKMSALVTQLMTEWLLKKRKGEPVTEADKDALLDKMKVFDEQ